MTEQQSQLLSRGQTHATITERSEEDSKSILTSKISLSKNVSDLERKVQMLEDRLGQKDHVILL